MFCKINLYKYFHFSQEFYVTTHFFYYIIFCIFGLLSSCLTSFLYISKNLFFKSISINFINFCNTFYFFITPSNLYISCIFYQFFGFLDPIPLHFIFLESKDYNLFITTTKYFWNPLFGILGCSFCILRTYSFTILSNAIQDYLDLFILYLIISILQFIFYISG